MRGFAVGLLIGFLLASACLGAVTTFSQVQGRGTYAAGYQMLPRCPTDTSTAEFGAICARESKGDILVWSSGGPRIITTSAYIP